MSTLIIPLHGVECHVCGLPAAWFVDGVTLPCRCGARTRDQLENAVAAARSFRQHDAERQGHVRMLHERRARESGRPIPTTEVSKEDAAWVELIDALQALAQGARAG